MFAMQRSLNRILGCGARDRSGPKGSPMKIKFDIDCTPEEARRFLGLPDVAPMQENVMKEVERRLMSNMQASDPEQLLKTWLPAGVQGFEQLQQIFWKQMAAGMGAGGMGASGKDASGKDKGPDDKK
jgi:hypothetical protein